MSEAQEPRGRGHGPRLRDSAQATDRAGPGRLIEYRQYLFEDLSRRLAGRLAPRILEIGPKDGLDTRRLLGLHPDQLTLIDLPGRNLVQVPASGKTVVVYVPGDVLECGPDPYGYDLIWCSGVLYHVKAQYCLVKKLYDWLRPGGHLVLESATIRRRWLRHQRCVEILYPPSERVKRRYHLSYNVTHLPSQSAVRAWLEMVGFEEIERSDCHRRVSRKLARTRVAYLARRPSCGDSMAVSDATRGRGADKPA